MKTSELVELKHTLKKIDLLYYLLILITYSFYSTNGVSSIGVNSKQKFWSGHDQITLYKLV